MATPLGGTAIGEAPVHLRRALGAGDLTFLCVVAIANLNIVPVVAANGPTTLWLWLAALIFFFLPQGITVIELAHRFPKEGGLYVWAKEAFGDFHGFLCGWCYWITNMLFLPTLLFYLMGVVTYTGGPGAAHLAESPLFFFSFTVGLLWLVTFANIRGLGVGKWFSNAGGIGTLIAATVLIGLALITVWQRGIRLPAGSFAIEKIDWKIVSSFGVICFGLVGLELGPIMGDEIRDPKRNVPKGIMIGGTLSGLLYICATAALLLAVPQQNMKVLQGILQGVDEMAGPLSWRWLLFLLAFLIGLSLIGSTSAWLGGSARILFVSGLDRYLPAVFGRVHSRYATPHVALMAMAALSSVMVAMSFVGKTSVKEAYVTLLDLSVVLQMVSYLYLYGALAKLAFAKRRTRGVYGDRALQWTAISGLVTTTVGMIVAFVPSRQVESVWRFEVKMFVTCILFIGAGIGLFAYYSRRQSVTGKPGLALD